MNFKYHIYTLSFSALALLFGFTSCVNDDLEKKCPRETVTFDIVAQVAPMNSPFGATHTRSVNGTNRDPEVDDQGVVIDGTEDENYIGKLGVILKKGAVVLFKETLYLERQEFKRLNSNTISFPVKITQQISRDDKITLRIYANAPQDNFEESSTKKQDWYEFDTPAELKKLVEEKKRGIPMVSPEYTFTLRDNVSTNKLTAAMTSGELKPVELVRSVAHVRITITNVNPNTGKPYKGVETLSFAGLKGYGLNLPTNPWPEFLKGTKDDSGKDEHLFAKTDGMVKVIKLDSNGKPEKDRNDNYIYEKKQLDYPILLKDPVRVTVIDRYVPDNSLDALSEFSPTKYTCYFLATLKGSDPVGNLGNFEPGGEIGDTRGAIDANVTVGNSSDLLFRIYSNFNGTPNFAIVRNTFYDFTANIRGRNKSDFTLKLEVPDYVHEEPLIITDSSSN